MTREIDGSFKVRTGPIRNGYGKETEQEPNEWIGGDCGHV